MTNKKIYIDEEHHLEDLTSISKTIVPLAKQLIGTNGFLEIDMINNWKTIVGEDLSQFSVPQKIAFKKNEKSGGVLYLVVLGGAFAMEVKNREKQILDNINVYFGYNAVEKIKIIQNNYMNNLPITQNNDEKTKKLLVSSEERKYILGLVRDVENPELRKKLENIGCNIFNHQKGVSSE